MLACAVAPSGTVKSAAARRAGADGTRAVSLHRQTAGRARQAVAAAARPSREVSAPFLWRRRCGTTSAARAAVFDGCWRGGARRCARCSVRQVLVRGGTQLPRRPRPTRLAGAPAGGAALVVRSQAWKALLTRTTATRASISGDGRGRSPDRLGSASSAEGQPDQSRDDRPRRVHGTGGMSNGDARAATLVGCAHAGGARRGRTKPGGSPPPWLPEPARRELESGRLLPRRPMPPPPDGKRYVELRVLLDARRLAERGACRMSREKPSRRRTSDPSRRSSSRRESPPSASTLVSSISRLVSRAPPSPPRSAEGRAVTFDLVRGRPCAVVTKLRLPSPEYLLRHPTATSSRRKRRTSVDRPRRPQPAALRPGEADQALARCLSMHERGRRCRAWPTADGTAAVSTLLCARAVRGDRGAERTARSTVRSAPPIARTTRAGGSSAGTPPVPCDQPSATRGDDLAWRIDRHRGPGAAPR